MIIWKALRQINRAEVLIRKLQGKKVKKQGFDLYFYECQLVKGEKGALLEATSCCKY